MGPLGSELLHFALPPPYHHGAPERVRHMHRVTTHSTVPAPALTTAQPIQTLNLPQADSLGESRGRSLTVQELAKSLVDLRDDCMQEIATHPRQFEREISINATVALWVYGVRRIQQRSREIIMNSYLLNQHLDKLEQALSENCKNAAAHVHKCVDHHMQHVSSPLAKLWYFVVFGKHPSAPDISNERTRERD